MNSQEEQFSSRSPEHETGEGVEFRGLSEAKTFLLVLCGISAAIFAAAIHPLILIGAGAGAAWMYMNSDDTPPDDSYW